MARVVHFEFLAEDPERATGFWSRVFGWDVPAAPGQTYWPMRTGTEPPGIDGAVMRREDFARASGRPPAAGTLCTIQVPALAATLAAVTEAGGRVLVPEREIPGVGRVAYCEDTEGTPFGIIEPAAG
jgi:predicted enzyme related to lactoylglutathione lyase